MVIIVLSALKEYTSYRQNRNYLTSYKKNKEISIAMIKRHNWKSTKVD